VVVSATCEVTTLLVEHELGLIFISCASGSVCCSPHTRGSPKSTSLSASNFVADHWDRLFMNHVIGREIGTVLHGFLALCLLLNLRAMVLLLDIRLPGKWIIRWRSELNCLHQIPYETHLSVRPEREDIVAAHVESNE